MKTYAVQFNESEDVGLFGYGLVINPAMKSAFIALKDEKETVINLAGIDDKEYTLLGVALIPDKPIYRKLKDQDGFFITFSKDVIKRAAHTFLKRGHQHNATIEHENKVDGVSVVEQWIVKDPNNDTANAYGLPKEDIVEGALVVKMKCDNKEIYNKALNGEIKGFSIEGLFNLKEINLKSENKMAEIKTEETVEAVKTGFMAWLSETFAPKKDEVKEDLKDEVETKTEEPKEVIEEPKKEEEINLTEVVADLTKQFETKLSEVQEGHKKEIEKIEDEKKVLEVKLSEKKKVHTPRADKKEYSEMSNLEKMEYNKLNK